MMRTGSVILMAAFAAACGDADAGAEAPPHAAAKQPRFDVAGVRPGMSSEEARGTLQRQGWNIVVVRDQSWDELVEYDVKRQRNADPDFSRKTGIGAMEATKGDERIEVKMHPVPGGAKVSIVNYTAPTAGRSSDQIREQMTSRYGKPDRSSPTGSPIEMTYCTGGERCNDAFGARNPALGVGLRGGVEMRINLFEGSDAERAWRGSLDRAVAARMGQKSSF